jgi:hypothetical protein
MNATFSPHSTYSAHHAHTEELRRRAAQGQLVRIARKLRAR